MNVSRHTNPPRDTLENERNAYNVTFCEMGLDWFWDAETFARLRASSLESSRVRAYLETRSPHLLRAYDADFLVNAIEAQRTRIAQHGAAR